MGGPLGPQPEWLRGAAEDPCGNVTALSVGV